MERVCTECGRDAARLRKQRCDACYMRIYRNGEVVAGATCCGCGERRRSVLTHAPLGAAEAVVCGNCALVVARTRPRVESVEDLERLVSRERRRVFVRQPDGRRSTDARAAPMPTYVIPQLDVSVD